MAPMTVAAVVMRGALDPPMALPVSTSYLAKRERGALHWGHTYSLPRARVVVVPFVVHSFDKVLITFETTGDFN